jgi:hypothetical protein
MSNPSNPNIILPIYVANTGQLVELNVDTNMSVKDIKWLISNKLAIPAAHQILLLADGTKLHSQANFNRLDKGEIYVFNKEELVNPSSSSSSSHLVDDYDKAVLLPVVSSSSSLLTPQIIQSNSVMLNNLPEYERLFSHHNSIASAYVTNIEERVSWLFSHLSCQRHQYLAVCAAQNNLKGHSTHLSGSISTLFTEFNELTAQFTTLSDEFDSLLGHLSSVQLFSPVPNNSMTLLDSLNETKLKNHYKSAVNELNILTNKTNELKQLYEALDHSVHNNIYDFSPPSLSLIHYDSLQQDYHHNYTADTAELEKLLSELSGDHEKLVAFIQECEMSLSSASSSLTNSEQLRTKVIQFEAQNTKHQTLILPAYKAADDKYKKLQLQLAQLHKHLNHYYTHVLTNITNASSTIKSILSSLPLYSEAIERLKKSLSKFQSLHRLPAAYSRSLGEIERRAKWKNLFINTAQQMINQLTQLHNEEIQRRTSFYLEAGQYLPSSIPFSKEINQSAIEAPEIIIKDFDQNLPNINIDHESQVTVPAAPASTVWNDYYSLQSCSSASAQRYEAMELENSYLKAELATLKQKYALPQYESTELQAITNQAQADDNQKQLTAAAIVIKQLKEKLDQSSPSSALSQLKEELSRSRRECSSLASAAIGLKQSLDESREDCELWKEISANKLSYKQFSTQDLVLFIPTAQGHYLALNDGALPNRFLAVESQYSVSKALKQQHNNNETEATALGRKLIGQIISMESFTVESAENNPYSLPLHTKYYKLFIDIATVHWIAE